MATDPFNSGELALTPEQVAELAPLQKKVTPTKVKGKTAHAQFIILPYKQTLAAAGRLGDAALAVLVELTYRRFKTHRNPVCLPSQALQAAGISRWAKKRALKQLEKARIVKVVNWRGHGHAPSVKILI